jgi:hypothetical protein
VNLVWVDAAWGVPLCSLVGVAKGWWVGVSFKAVGSTRVFFSEGKKRGRENFRCVSGRCPGD